MTRIRWHCLVFVLEDVVGGVFRWALPCVGGSVLGGRGIVGRVCVWCGGRCGSCFLLVEGRWVVAYRVLCRGGGGPVVGWWGFVPFGNCKKCPGGFVGVCWGGPFRVVDLGY